MSAKKEISLLSENDNSQSISSLILRWTTTVGRLLIILTELIVVGAFISRFWLDRKNADLSETLRQQKAIISSTKEFESEFNSLQTRLNFIKTFRQSTTPLTSKMVNLSQSIPPEINVTAVAVKDGDAAESQVDLKASAFNEQNIVDLITNLTLNPNIKSVEIGSIEKKSNTNKFDLVLSLVITSPPSINGI